MANKSVNKNIAIVTALIVASIAVIAYVDMIVRPGYVLKTMVKAPIFFLVPVVYSLINKDFKPFSALKPNAKGMKTSLLLGIGIYFIVVGGYLLANSMFDLSGIKTSLEQNLGIDKSNFIIIGIYVAVCNSFLEEWFFRGFAFSGFLSKSRKLAYIASSLFFAIYHIAIMDGMFSLPLLVLVLVGLFVGGTIFNYLNEKNNNIYSSWFCHSFANMAMTTVGVLIFL